MNATSLKILLMANEQNNRLSQSPSSSGSVPASPLNKNSQNFDLPLNPHHHHHSESGSRDKTSQNEELAKIHNLISITKKQLNIVLDNLKSSKDSQEYISVRLFVI